MKNILYVIILVLITSCKNDSQYIFSEDCISDETRLEILELSMDEYLSIVPLNNKREITENEAMNIAFNFIESNNLSEKKTGVINDKSVRKEYFNTSDCADSKNGEKSTMLPIYNIKISDKNIDKNIIVSGVGRLPSIIAYFEVDNQYEEKNTQNDLLIDFAKFNYAKDVAYFELAIDSLRKSTLDKVSRFFSIPVDSININNIKNKLALEQIENKSRADIITDPSDINGRIIGRYGPWCDVKWDIGMPYNRKMPQVCPNNWFLDNRYGISSIVVAVAQTLAYFKPHMNVYGEIINWDYLKVNEEIHEYTDYFGSYVADPIERRDMVANLMKYIGEQCNVIYNCDGSSINPSNFISFLKRYNISVIQNGESINTAKLINYIESLNPVIMYGQTTSGGGHWWLVDGMITVMNGARIDKYIHANMGMGKSYSGYYYVNANQSLTFNPSFAHFQKNIKMYPYTL